jgi:hypothetical protein
MMTTWKQEAYAYTRRVFALPNVVLVFAVFSIKTGKAQTDPKLHPGEAVKVTRVTLVKKATGKSPGDSTMNVKVEYIKPDGSPAMVNFTNVAYSHGPGDSTERKAHIKMDDGTEQDISPQEAGDWVKFIIQNPPDKVYYIDGIEAKREVIKDLDVSKIKTAVVFKDDEAVAKYGERARKGVILFTTK